MKFKNLLFAVLASAFMLGACSDDNDEPEVIKPDESLSGDITSNRTLTADRVWLLDGMVTVKNNSVLTIQPGTVIKAAKGKKSTLVVLQGSKLMADGTRDKPIVFTSNEDKPKPGDWGGIVLVGRATTNRTTPVVVEGGVNVNYGTEKIDNDNSGVLRYVRIEYAGIGTNDSELNALSLYAVGNGTVLDHIQTSYANDDAFEFFGGTVNATHLVAYATADDDFDFDFGYSGSIQYAVALRVPTFSDPLDDANGIECDNDKDGTAATPVTHPKISNMTLIGPNNAEGTATTRHAYGNRWRRGSKFTFNNSIILGSQKEGFYMESEVTAGYYKDGSSQFKNNIVASYGAPFGAKSSALTAADIEKKALSEGNMKMTATDVKLTNPFNLDGPNFLPAAGSEALKGDFVSVPGAKTETFRGAFGSTDWTKGWTRFGK